MPCSLSEGVWENVPDDMVEASSTNGPRAVVRTPRSLVLGAIGLVVRGIEVLERVLALFTPWDVGVNVAHEVLVGGGRTPANAPFKALLVAGHMNMVYQVAVVLRFEDGVQPEGSGDTERFDGDEVDHTVCGSPPSRFSSTPR